MAAVVLLTILSIGATGATPPVTLAVSGRANANVALAAQGSFVVATWSAAVSSGAQDIFAAVSRDAGRTFSPPARVNTVPGQANINGEQPARVALVPKTEGVPAIVVVWTAKGSDGTMLLTTQSVDGGRTFAPAVRVAGSEAPGNRGWEAIAVDAAGRVNIVWLDHRALAAAGGRTAMTHHDTSHPGGAAPAADGVAMAQQSKLYYGTILTPDLKVGLAAGAAGSTSGGLAPRAITGGVCYCCKTAIVPTGARTLALAWRHVYPGNLRDIAFAVSRDAGKTFESSVRVSEDKWQLEGCPDDGPSMVADAAGRFHVLWPTLVANSTIGLFYSTSRDGKAFAPRVRVPTEGLAHHPQIAMSRDGALALAWDELVDGKRRVVFARAAASANPPDFRREILSSTEGSVYPALAVTADGVVAAWASGPTGGTAIQVVKR